jgi:hypothetical protein
MTAVRSSLAKIFRFGPTGRLVFAMVAAASTMVTAEPTRAASVQEIFEKYNLLGTFSWDCSKPPSANNLYFVHRLLDANQVQRDQMSGQTTRDWVVLVVKASEARPNEILVSGAFTGRLRGRDLESKAASGIWRLEPNRLLQWEGTVDGDKVVVT